MNDRIHARYTSILARIEGQRTKYLHEQQHTIEMLANWLVRCTTDPYHSKARAIASDVIGDSFDAGYLAGRIDRNDELEKIINQGGQTVIKWTVADDDSITAHLTKSEVDTLAKAADIVRQLARFGPAKIADLASVLAWMTESVDIEQKGTKTTHRLTFKESNDE